MRAPSVTVVIPTRNRLLLLREAVTSVLNQTLEDWQLVIVDDASEDGSSEWLGTLADPRMTTSRLERHTERSAARNRGLAEAMAEFVLFLDDDDRLRPRALELLRRSLVKRRSAVAAVGGRVVFDGRGHRRRASHPWVPITRGVLHDVLLGWVGLQGQCLFRAAALRKCGGWNETMVVAEDQELWLRIAPLGPVRLIPQVVLENRAHAGQWRLAGVEAVEDGFRRSFVASLRGVERDRGARVLGARAKLGAASVSHQRNEFGRALSCHWRALRIAPELFVSPLLAPRLLSAVLKAVLGVILGPRGFAWVRDLKAVWLNQLRRDPGARPDVKVRAGVQR